MNIRAKYELWLQNAVADPDLVEELRAVGESDSEIEERFFKELEFGTGGLRGIIGAGTARMNVYTVAKATQGLAEYLKTRNPGAQVAVSFDSRIKSDLFARKTAEVLAGNGLRVWIYPELMPTPMLSFAVRHLGCDAGVMVTASHNPAEYNGYKAYGPDGCQLNPDAAARVLEYMEKIDPFRDVRSLDFEEGLQSGKIRYIGDDVREAYFAEVLKMQTRPGLCESSDLSVVYTPLHGSGNKPVREILRRIGLKNVTVVPEQELPDGNFPTAPYPNPEIREAFDRALKLAETVKPDLLLATDPDCDRVGIAVRTGNEFKLMTGNEVGALLLHYVITRRKEAGTLPQRPVAVKTIVTSEICAGICKKYGVELRNVLTGFKFIGEQIGLLEAAGEEDRYVFGFEESYGYLAGTYVRDKDAVVASMLICEMAAHYKREGKTLLDAMEALYDEFGMFLAEQKSFTCEGVAGMRRMGEIMENLRANPPKEIAGFPVRRIEDYKAGRYSDTRSGETGPIFLPKSDVLAFRLDRDQAVIVRPSGTEPKIKVYMNAAAPTRAQAVEIAKKMAADMTALMGF